MAKLSESYHRRVQRLRRRPLQTLLDRYQKQLAQCELSLRNHDEEAIRRKAEISVLQDIIADLKAELEEGQEGEEAQLEDEDDDAADS